MSQFEDENSIFHVTRIPFFVFHLKMPNLLTLKYVFTEIDDDVQIVSEEILTPPAMICQIIEERFIWPTTQDLNTRLRRVITAYQRNYKKEELKQQQKAKVCATFSVIFRYLIT